MVIVSGHHDGFLSRIYVYLSFMFYDNSNISSLFHSGNLINFVAVCEIKVDILLFASEFALN